MWPVPFECTSTLHKLAPIPTTLTAWSCHASATLQIIAKSSQKCCAYPVPSRAPGQELNPRMTASVLRRDKLPRGRRSIPRTTRARLEWFGDQWCYSCHRFHFRQLQVQSSTIHKSADQKNRKCYWKRRQPHTTPPSWQVQIWAAFWYAWSLLVAWKVIQYLNLGTSCDFTPDKSLKGLIASIQTIFWFARSCACGRHFHATPRSHLDLLIPVWSNLFLFSFPFPSY